MKRWLRWRFLWIGLFCFFGVPSEAAQTTSSFPVTVQVVSVCTVATVPLNFGSMLSGETATQTVGIVTKCTKSTPYQLILDAGLHKTLGLRNMADGGGNRVPYLLYKDITNSVEWIAGVAGATNAIGTGLSVSHVLRGVVTPSALVPAGLYSDTVTVTISY